ncbi:bifunctional DNA primase/polymerase [Streptomyces sp. NPDC058084]|uniref:bifunctional DNA primase/polymerase n=1 Tax=Streptomyces sp. NPDC058084 TaxID=3346333 RepID=UPI0036DFB538
MPQDRLKAAALELAGRGWHVFPLRPGTTEPAIRDWAARATTNPWRIVRCWDAGPFNIGLVPCVSGLLVLDLLPAAPGEEPPAPFRGPGIADGADVLAVLLDEQQGRLPVETYSVHGPAGRLQYYFTHPEACPPAASRPLPWHVEVRCTGAYVPAAGSVTEDGAFVPLHDGPVAPAPPWLLARR